MRPLGSGRPPRWLAWVLVGVGLLSAPPAAAKPAPSLRRAIAFFNAGEDGRAHAELEAVLKSKGPSQEAARAHLYLGLLQVNALRSEAARTEFAQALTLDPMVELPFEASPKAEVLFNQARATLPTSAPKPAPSADVPPAAPPVQPPAPALILVQAEPPPPTRPSHALSLTVGIAGLAAAGTGGVFLGLSASSLSAARNQTFAFDAAAQARTSAQQQYVAEWLLGVGGGLVGVGVLVWVIESAMGGGSAQTAAPTAGRALSAALEGVQF